MKKSVVLTAVLVFLLIFSVNVFAGQPYSSYWFPNELLEWEAANDKDAEFNQGSIELSDRINSSQKMVNKNAGSKAEVVALSLMNPTTSNNPSQGSSNFDIYSFSYWQYIDQLVMWGGSAGEGLIVSPSSDVINAAHKNGVEVLGAIFMPPKDFGGKKKWVEDLIQKNENGQFPVADKLIEVAEYHNFDGWFINQETEGTTAAESKQMREFIAYLKNKSNNQIEIMWYDSMVENGEIDWQNALTEKNDGFLVNEDLDGFERDRLADSMFLNFWWEDMSESHNQALREGISPYNLFAGIDVQANGYNTEVNWEGLFPEAEKANTSLGLYIPSWTHSSSENHAEFYTKANRFWVGENRNPANTNAEADWPGIANYTPARSAVTSLPFISNFNTGNGHLYAVNGKVMSKEDWSNRGLQDILPSWRWLVESDGQGLQPEFDWTKAYYGGSSLKISGNLSPENKTLLRLYKTDLKINNNTALEIVFQQQSKNNSKAEIGISFKDSEDYSFYKFNDKNADKWLKKEIDLSAQQGKTIDEIALRFDSETEIKDYSVNIGRIAVREKKEIEMLPIKNGQISDLEIENNVEASFRLKWENNNPETISEIYRVYEDRENEFLGATYNNVYFVDKLLRNSPEEEKINLEIKVRDNHYNTSDNSVKLEFEWGEYPKPDANFYVGQTFIAPGETIEFKNESAVANEYKWFFSGGEPLKSTAENPKVTYNEEGEFRVTLMAKNEVGQDVFIKDSLITVRKREEKELEDAAYQKEIKASGFVEGEGPELAIDNNPETKWCATGDEPHTITVDLAETKKINAFKLSHAEAGGESADFNTEAYSISISQDGEKWREVVNVKDNSEAKTEKFIESSKARYVKLSINKAAQNSDTAARIYDFKVMVEVEKYNNYAYQKEVEVSGNVDGEGPALALDQTVKNNSKWAAIGDEPHWLEVDLGENKTINKFVVKHAEAGGEGANYNTKDFVIEISEDGETWNEIVEIKDNTAGVTEHPIKETSARYARLTVMNATQGGDTAARIYEFQVLGLKEEYKN